MVQGCPLLEIVIKDSIEAQLDGMTQDDVDRYCGITEVDTMTPAEFRKWFEDYTMTGLAQLLTARLTPSE